MINGSVSVAIGVMLQLLSFSIAQCTLDQEKEHWRTFFDQSSNGNGAHIFDRLLVVYENRLNTESNDTLKLTVSNMIKAVLHLSVTAKRQAIESEDSEGRRWILITRRLARGLSGISIGSSETGSDETDSRLTAIGSMRRQSESNE